MTTDEKKEALRDAGVKFRSNASEDTIDALYAQFEEGGEATTEESSPVEPGEGAKVEITHSDESPPKEWTVTDEGPTGEAGPVGVGGVDAAPSEEAPAEAETVEESEPEPVKTGSATMEDFEKFRAANADKMLGSKTPVVFQWADENLSAEDFNEIYAGRTIAGRVIATK